MRIELRAMDTNGTHVMSFNTLQEALDNFICIAEDEKDRNPGLELQIRVEEPGQALEREPEFMDHHELYDYEMFED